ASKILYVEVVHGVERFHPSVLREIVVVKPESSAKNSVPRRAEAVRNSQPWSERFAIVVWNSGDDAVTGERRVQVLFVAGSHEEAECGVVAQAVIKGQSSRDAPGILGIEAEALHILRKAAVACGSDGARRAGSDIWRRRRRASSEVGAELLRVCGVFARIEDKGGESFRVGRERATQDGLVNEIDTEPRSVISDVASDIVTQLVLFLIPKNGKRGDGG